MIWVCIVFIALSVIIIYFMIAYWSTEDECRSRREITTILATELPLLPARRLLELVDIIMEYRSPMERWYYVAVAMRAPQSIKFRGVRYVG